MNSKTDAIGLESQMESRNKGKCLKNEKKKKNIYIYIYIKKIKKYMLKKYLKNKK